LKKNIIFVASKFFKYSIMSIVEQQELKEKYYSEATRYMDNAREYLKNFANAIIEKIKPLTH